MNVKLRKALSCIDWQQVVLNGGPPCSFIEGERFRLRAQRWAGHEILHGYVSLADLLSKRFRRRPGLEAADWEGVIKLIQHMEDRRNASKNVREVP